MSSSAQFPLLPPTGPEFLCHLCPSSVRLQQRPSLEAQVILRHARSEHGLKCSTGPSFIFLRAAEREFKEASLPNSGNRTLFSDFTALTVTPAEEADILGAALAEQIASEQQSQAAFPFIPDISKLRNSKNAHLPDETILRRAQEAAAFKQAAAATALGVSPNKKSRSKVRVGGINNPENFGSDGPSLAGSSYRVPAANYLGGAGSLTGQNGYSRALTANSSADASVAGGSSSVQYTGNNGAPSHHGLLSKNDNEAFGAFMASQSASDLKVGLQSLQDGVASGLLSSNVDVGHGLPSTRNTSSTKPTLQGGVLPDVANSCLSSGFIDNLGTIAYQIGLNIGLGLAGGLAQGINMSHFASAFANSPNQLLQPPAGSTIVNQGVSSYVAAPSHPTSAAQSIVNGGVSQQSTTAVGAGQSVKEAAIDPFSTATNSTSKPAEVASASEYSQQSVNVPVTEQHIAIDCNVNESNSNGNATSRNVAAEEDRVVQLFDDHVDNHMVIDEAPSTIPTDEEIVKQLPPGYRLATPADYHRPIDEKWLAAEKEASAERKAAAKAAKKVTKTRSPSKKPSQSAQKMAEDAVNNGSGDADSGAPSSTAPFVGYASVPEAFFDPSAFAKVDLFPQEPKDATTVDSLTQTHGNGIDNPHFNGNDFDSFFDSFFDAGVELPITGSSDPSFTAFSEPNDPIHELFSSPESDSFDLMRARHSVPDTTYSFPEDDSSPENYTFPENCCFPDGLEEDYFSLRK